MGWGRAVGLNECVRGSFRTWTEKLIDYTVWAYREKNKMIEGENKIRGKLAGKG